MKFPQKIPGFKFLLVVWGVYTAVWISLEGELWRVVLMGVATTVVAAGYLWQRWLGGKQVRRGMGVGITAVIGLLIGSGSVVMVLIFMAVKSGLHAHGAEFRPAEIDWLFSQLPLWTAVGLLTGLGLGLVWVGTGESN
ncbi:hypothetical protein MNBD_CHLOROFLEXI01-1529 [hydrothermal vent metagenome]|uniref:Uncharacterized protein n=1 Tax=hydrothermal vent metagenome TaxID=652676 RepID=A0A3B0VNJ5_9ZZZZ